jgi:hypothetical protein
VCNPSRSYTSALQIFIGGELVGGASDLMNLIEADVLTDMLNKAEDRKPFPPKITDLLSERVSRSTDAAKSSDDEKAEALRKTLADELLWREQRVEYVTAVGFCKNLLPFLAAGCADDSQLLLPPYTLLCATFLGSTSNAHKSQHIALIDAKTLHVCSPQSLLSSPRRGWGHRADRREVFEQCTPSLTISCVASRGCYASKLQCKQTSMQANFSASKVCFVLSGAPTKRQTSRHLDPTA